MRIGVSAALGALGSAVSGVRGTLFAWTDNTNWSDGTGWTDAQG